MQNEQKSENEGDMGLIGEQKKRTKYEKVGNEKGNGMDIEYI